ncbi:ATP-binding mismatch repair protein [Amphichorda felina]
MATIKQIEGRTVHQIQSGQVIVDLCSVTKELVENSIDAGASNIDVRFKNQGLDLIEVQDNGRGISSANYSSVALKHHTSKLSSYADIGSLETFGFRGEALASLCALSIMNITTCLQEDAPKGSRLSFEASGKLRGTSIVAAQKGTTVSVEKLFHNLPVRRRELERNIKREWHKVIALLNQYACIQTNTKFTVSQQPTKGKRIVLFATKGNNTTRDNIINIFGAKTMSALVPLGMTLEMEPSGLSSALRPTVDPCTISKEVRLVGYISRPTQGDGRQTPDRQMFFINGRPCGLPQFAKTFNEVYKSYNSTQSPFIFADIQLDTHMYDVNVSPDKRTILLHDQNQLLNTIRTSLVDLFDSHDYSVPVSQLTRLKPSSSSQKVSSTLNEALTQVEKPEPLPGSPVQESSIDNVSSSDYPSPTVELSQTQRSRGKVTRSETGGSNTDNLLDRWIMKRDTQRHPVGDSASKDTSISTPDDEEPSSSDIAGTPGEGPTTWTVEDFTPNVSKAPNTTPIASSSQLASLSELRDDSTTVPPVQFIKGTRQGSDHLAHGSSSKRAPGPTSIVIGKQQSISGSRDPHTDPSRHVVEDEEDEEEKNEENEENEDDIRSLEEEEDGDGGVDDDEPSDGGRPSFGTVLSQSGQDKTPNFPGEGKLAAKQDAEVSTVAKPRLQSLQGSSRRRDATLQLAQGLQIDANVVQSRMESWLDHVPNRVADALGHHEVEDITASDAESKLSLIISKSDFARMRVAGQFNMGFIIAIRPAENGKQDANASEHDELFIIDQHASDEKYNFERLQDFTVVQSQRLVHPKRLELTALEEEIVMQSTAAIGANGFKIEVDMDGEWPVGSRCQLTALPLSRETTFNIADLEELISLLGDESSESKHIPRPSKSDTWEDSTSPGIALMGGQR